MKNIINILLLSFLLFSCNNNSKNKESKNQELNELQDETFFSFTLNANFENDDRIHIFYLTPKVTKITVKNSMYTDVLGSQIEQQINFNLPNDVIPTRVFIKFGENGEQKIKVKNIKLSYGTNNINIPDSLFIQFFNPNKSVIYNKEDYSIEANSSNNQSPMFFSRTILENKIDLTFM